MPMARQCSDELPSREAGAQDRELDGRVERHVCAHAGRKERQDGKRQAREAAAGRVAVVCGVVYHQVSCTERTTATHTLWACDV